MTRMPLGFARPRSPRLLATPEETLSAMDPWNNTDWGTS